MFVIDFDFRVNRTKIKMDTIADLESFIAYLSNVRASLEYPFDNVTGLLDTTDHTDDAPTAIASPSHTTRNTFPVKRVTHEVLKGTPDKTIDIAVSSLHKAHRPMKARELATVMARAGWITRSPNPVNTLASIVRKPGYAKYIAVSDGDITLTQLGREYAGKLLMEKISNQDLFDVEKLKQDAPHE